jgi:ABC-type Zn2+ transport system substrate-binding protein/surface adhesin
MCKEGVDITTLKVSIKQGADRLRLEQDHLRQWAALSANVDLEGVSGKLQESLKGLAEAEGLLKEAIAELVEFQMHGHTHDHGHDHGHSHDHGHDHGHSHDHGPGGITITPV